ncbi:hypothetical protein IV494_10930 [Kaistella sp. G5-32]|uniref:DUF4352 domain-containing protein n=1 Tax=Kaistella gelatinilytica TaxID=2787636 RepID=A0ABS0FDA3_9FLAO|nr:hypothetical protein [Kaistella gelatinilytica]MBF8457693.1 hypothetical protein [Kaistella gelatinilytica]
MKTVLVLIPLLILSCTKKEAVISSSSKQDSMKTTNQNEVIDPADYLPRVVNVPTTIKPKEISKTFRVIDGDSIIKTINGDMIPLTIDDEFKTDRQKFILKIKNFTGKNMVAKVTSKNSDMNIRFNQIKFANGTFDGPFGSDISTPIDKPGEIWLIIGKNLMADGKPTGKFSVSLK